MSVLYTWRPEDDEKQRIVTFGNHELTFRNFPLLGRGQFFAPHINTEPVRIADMPPLGVPSTPHEPSQAAAGSLSVSVFLNDSLDTNGMMKADSSLRMHSFDHTLYREAFGDSQGREASPLSLDPRAQERAMRLACKQMLSGKPANIQSGLYNNATEKRLVRDLGRHLVGNARIRGMDPADVVRIIDAAYDERAANNPKWRSQLLWERAMIGVAAQKMLDSDGAKFTEEQRTMLKAVSVITPEMERKLLDPSLKLPMDFYATFARGMLRRDGIAVTGGNCAAKAKEMDEKEAGSKHSFYAQLANTSTLSAESRAAILKEEGAILRAMEFERNGTRIRPVMVAKGQPITDEMLATACQQVVAKDGRPMTEDEMRLLRYTLLHECGGKGEEHTYKERKKDGSYGYASTALGPLQLVNKTRRRLMAALKERGIDYASLLSLDETAEGNDMHNLTLAVALWREEFRGRVPSRGASDDSLMRLYGGVWHFGSMDDPRIEGDMIRSYMAQANAETRRLFATTPLSEVNRYAKSGPESYVAEKQGPLTTTLVAKAEPQKPAEAPKPKEERKRAIRVEDAGRHMRRAKAPKSDPKNPMTVEVAESPFGETIRGVTEEIAENDAVRKPNVPLLG